MSSCSELVSLHAVTYVYYTQVWWTYLTKRFLRTYVNVLERGSPAAEWATKTDRQSEHTRSLAFVCPYGMQIVRILFSTFCMPVFVCPSVRVRPVR